MLYDLINPSDKITLEAPTVEIACYCAWTLSWMMWVEDENGESSGIPAFHGGELMSETLWDFEKFLETNKTEIAKCFMSFTHGDFQTYKDHKKALECITDPEERKKS